MSLRYDENKLEQFPEPNIFLYSNPSYKVNVFLGNWSSNSGLKVHRRNKVQGKNERQSKEEWRREDEI